MIIAHIIELAYVHFHMFVFILQATGDMKVGTYPFLVGM